MNFNAIVLRIQLKTPKMAIIRAGASVAEIEAGGGVPTATPPSIALREEICRKLADAYANNSTSIDLKVEGGIIVESGST